MMMSDMFCAVFLSILDSKTVKSSSYPILRYVFGLEKLCLFDSVWVWQPGRSGVPTQATNHFHEQNRLGVGSFGGVFRGIQRDGTEIAIKVRIQDKMRKHEKALLDSRWSM